MLGFKKNNYLKRKDFINLVDSDKIWSKSMTLREIKDLLEKLESEILKYNFDEDNDFLMDGRREGLKYVIEERLSKEGKKNSDDILESLFNFWEFVNNEYYVITPSMLQKNNMTKDQAEDMCKKYTKKGIICKEEKNVILQMIQTIKESIN